MTEEELQALLTIEQFAAWLDTHNPTDTVGISQSTYQCPIAHYLISHSVAVVFVSPETIACGNVAIPTPPWAEAFIHAVDDQRKQQVNVSTRGAKRWLADAKHQTEEHVC